MSPIKELSKELEKIKKEQFPENEPVIRDRTLEISSSEEICDSDVEMIRELVNRENFTGFYVDYDRIVYAKFEKFETTQGADLRILQEKKKHAEWKSRYDVWYVARSKRLNAIQEKINEQIAIKNDPAYKLAREMEGRLKSWGF